MGIEPVLQSIASSSLIASTSPYKVIAYADDLTSAIKKVAVNSLIQLIEEFSEITNLTLNQTKTEILCRGEAPVGMTKSNEVRILGVIFSADSQSINLSAHISYANKARFYCNKSNTFIARAHNIETFVMQKLVFQTRHKIALKRHLEKIDSILVDAIWLGRKHNLKKSILQQPAARMGINLKNFTCLVVASKIFDIKNFFFQLLEESEVQIAKNSKLLRNLKTLTKTFGCRLTFDHTGVTLWQ